PTALPPLSLHDALPIWLSPAAIAQLKRIRRGILRRPEPPPPLLPVKRLTLGGLVYTSIFNQSDRRKNVRDLLSAFLLAFRDRPEDRKSTRLNSSHLGIS